MRIRCPNGAQTTLTEYEFEAAITAKSEVSAEVVVLRDLPIQAQGYFLALRRLRDDVANGRDPYISLVETINWLTAISNSKAPGLKGDVDIQAVRFARHRAHHDFASSVENAGSGWTWRAAAALPRPTDPRHDKEKQRQLYERRLQGKPVLDVFDRLEPKIAKAAPGSDAI